MNTAFWTYARRHSGAVLLGLIGFLAIGQAANALTVESLEFRWPDATFGRYHIAASVTNDSDNPVKVQSVMVGDGEAGKGFAVFAAGTLSNDDVIAPGQRATVRLAHPWRGSEQYAVVVAGAQGEQAVVAEGQAQAPARGGYWDPAWKHYKVVELAEEAGLDRTNEPVRLSLNFRADRLRDPAKELRLVALSDTGEHREIPFQVLDVSSVETTEEQYPDTIACRVLFYAEVPAKATRRYLVFHDNPDAPAPAAAPTELSVTGEGLELTVENPYYKMTLAGQSGQINGIFVKQGVDQQLSHSGNAIHWNPGCYAPPRPWGHTYDWNPPEGMQAIGGPLAHVFTRWGPLPQLPEVWVSVTYTWYAHCPYVEMSSTISITDDIDVLALRNDEMVFEEALFTDLGWRDLIGGTHTRPLGQNPDLGKGYTAVLPADTPWLCFYSRDGGYGCGSVRLAYDATSTSPAEAVTFNENTFVTAPQGIVYWYRALVYHFFPEFKEPAHLFSKVNKGSVYHETNAYLPFALSTSGGDLLAPIDDLYARLASPLRVKSVDWGRDGLIAASLRGE